MLVRSWQNVTSSRSLNTTYTNSTGRLIAVSISEDGADGFIELYVNDVAGNEWK